MTTAAKIRLNLPDFIQQFESQPFELINGEMIPMSPSALGSSFLANKLARWIHQQAETLGETLVEVTFVLTEGQTWVTGSRVPDVIFIKAEKFAAYKQAHPDWQSRPMMLVPDLAVEVMSPSDTFARTRDKAELYLKDGVSLVWVIDPERKVIYSYDAQNPRGTPLTEGDILTARELIPPLEIDIRSLFD